MGAMFTYLLCSIPVLVTVQYYLPYYLLSLFLYLLLLVAVALRIVYLITQCNAYNEYKKCNYCTTKNYFELLDGNTNSAHFKVHVFPLVQVLPAVR